MIEAVALALILAVPPPGRVRVRVMERQHPQKLELEAGQAGSVWCDGAPLRLSSVQLHLAGDQVEVENAGPRRCAEVRVDRPPLEQTVTSLGTELRVVATLPLEDYVASVVDAETETQRPAALQAQAIVSRTFAVREAGRHGEVDFCDLAHCQVFRLGTPRPEALAAARATAGEVLAFEGQPIHAYFHSACGGHTSRAFDVLGDALTPADLGVSDLDPSGKPWCASSPDASWTFDVRPAQLVAALGAPSPEEGIHVLERDEGGTVLRLRAFGLNFSCEAFKSHIGRALGWRAIRSCAFEIEERGGVLHFRGHGLGHRVGLCQVGADAQAAAGWSAERILRHYFPEARLEHLSDLAAGTPARAPTKMPP